jgi:S1-C subfamily serine protease
MRLHFLRSLTVALLAVAVTLVQADEPKCHSAARECEQQIRRMLSGRRYLGINVVGLKPGLVIKSVIPLSPAARADLKTGDRLMAVNGKTLAEASVSEFKEILSQANNTGKVWLIVMRRGAYRKVEARLEPYPKEYIDKVIAGHLSQAHTATAGGEP